MANILGNDKREQILALGRLGWSLRRIALSIRPVSCGQCVEAPHRSDLSLRPAGANSHPQSEGTPSLRSDNHGIRALSLYALTRESCAEVGTDLASATNPSAPTSLPLDYRAQRSTLRSPRAATHSDDIKSMRYCPNAICPDMKRTGMHAEYMDRVSACSACGSTLVDLAELYRRNEEAISVAAMPKRKDETFERKLGRVRIRAPRSLRASFPISSREDFESFTPHKGKLASS